MSEITLFKGDCLVEMNKIANKSIDMILCDLPYGTTACSWDIVIPFDKMWIQINRVIKDNGCVALFGSEPFSSKLRCSNLEMFRYDWIWKKPYKTLYPRASFRPLLEHENISMGSGSTGVACINTNRNFIGIEKDDEFFKIAKNRIEKVKESIFDV